MAALVKQRSEHHGRPVWSNASIAAVRSLWDDGHSIRTISARCGVSHNVIVGLAHRNSFPRRPSPIPDVLVDLAVRHDFVDAWNTGQDSLKTLSDRFGITERMGRSLLTYARKKGWNVSSRGNYEDRVTRARRAHSEWRARVGEETYQAAMAAHARNARSGRRGAAPT